MIKGSDAKILFVTGRLAEPSLRKTVASLAEKLGIRAEIFVAKVSVAALITPQWLIGKLQIPQDTQKVVLPGLCRGETETLAAALGGIAVVRGPTDLRDLPAFFHEKPMPTDYGKSNLEILAEINHADQLSPDDLLRLACQYRNDGADIIDLGCTPGQPWNEIGRAVSYLKSNGLRISVDSFDPEEVARATAAGAELVLSVNNSNVHLASQWKAEVVVIPDQPDADDWADQMAQCIEVLERDGVRYRLDPVLEPIGFGFARSLGRYLETRRRYPDAAIMMGIGNLTELTEVDSAGVNALLAGFCEETAIRSVLTTEVIGWAKSSVKELAVARQMMHHAVTHHTIPKHVDSRLVQLHDARINPPTLEELRQMQANIRDRNFRLFAAREGLVACNGEQFELGEDPFELFERLGITDPGHAFYLGWEMMKAATARQLEKNYIQDRPLQWGMHTRAEVSVHDRKKAAYAAQRRHDKSPANDGGDESEGPDRSDGTDATGSPDATGDPPLESNSSDPQPPTGEFS